MGEFLEREILPNTKRNRVSRVFCASNHFGFHLNQIRRLRCDSKFLVTFQLLLGRRYRFTCCVRSILTELHHDYATPYRLQTLSSLLQRNDAGFECNGLISEVTSNYDRHNAKEKPPRTSRRLFMISSSILLTFVRPHVAPAMF